MEGVALYYFNNYNMFIYYNPLSELYSYPSEDKNKYAIYTHAHTMNVYQKLMY